MLKIKKVLTNGADKINVGKEAVNASGIHGHMITINNESEVSFIDYEILSNMWFMGWYWVDN